MTRCVNFFCILAGAVQALWELKTLTRALFSRISWREL
jgi:hypothetical protein